MFVFIFYTPKNNSAGSHEHPNHHPVQKREKPRFMCSTDVSEAMQYEPWPNDMFAVWHSGWIPGEKQANESLTQPWWFLEDFC